MLVLVAVSGTLLFTSTASLAMYWQAKRELEEAKRASAGLREAISELKRYVAAEV